MALIKCTECGHEVSDKASVCPNCGAPVGLAQPSNQQLNNTYSNIDTEGSSSKKWLYLVVGILAVSLLGLAAWLFLFNEDKQNQTKQIVDSKSVTNVEKDTSSSGNDIIDNQSMNLKGKIGNYPITMHLEFDNKNVSGYYSYNSGSSKLLLKGTINYNHIELNETTEEGRSTGHFDGKLTGDKFAGEFINYKGEHFNFTLANSPLSIEETERAERNINSEGLQQEEDNSNSDEGEYVAGVLKKGNWAYSNSTDPMSDEVFNSALCMSNETLTICGQRTYLQLYLMHMPSGSNSVFVQIADGVLRQDKLPMIYFRFDNQEVDTFAVMANGAKAHLIPNEKKANDIINNLKKSKKCAIKVEAQDGGTETYTFNTEGLEWNY